MVRVSRSRPTGRAGWKSEFSWPAVQRFKEEECYTWGSNLELLKGYEIAQFYRRELQILSLGGSTERRGKRNGESNSRKSFPSVRCFIACLRFRLKLNSFPCQPSPTPALTLIWKTLTTFPERRKLAPLPILKEKEEAEKETHQDQTHLSCYRERRAEVKLDFKPSERVKLSFQITLKTCK